MEESKIFDIELEYEGREYKGYRVDTNIFGTRMTRIGRIIMDFLFCEAE